MKPFNPGQSPPSLGQVPMPASSPFQSAQRSLSARALPGPPWVWAGLACLAAGALAFVVTRAPAAPENGAHAALRAEEHRAAEASSQGASLPGPEAVADATEDQSTSGASAAAELVTSAPARAITAEGANAPPAARPADEPAQRVASGPRRTKKKARRPPRKRPARAE